MPHIFGRLFYSCFLFLLIGIIVCRGEIDPDEKAFMEYLCANNLFENANCVAKPDDWKKNVEVLNGTYIVSMYASQFNRPDLLYLAISR